MSRLCIIYICKHVNIALNVVKAWNFETYHIYREWPVGEYRKFGLFLRVPIWLLQQKYSIEGENEGKSFACIRNRSSSNRSIGGTS